MHMRPTYSSRPARPLSPHHQQPLTQSEFYEATWEVVNSPSTYATKWGPIEDWDTSGVPSFFRAFTTFRNETGEYAYNGNSKAATFNGDISKWDTSSATSMVATFNKAAAFNGDVSAWITSSVKSMGRTFSYATSFTGTGVDLWNINKVKDMRLIFGDADALTSCNKRKIADAWKSNAAAGPSVDFPAWDADKCPVSPLGASTDHLITISLSSTYCPLARVWLGFMELCCM